MGTPQPSFDLASIITHHLNRYDPSTPLDYLDYLSSASASLSPSSHPHPHPHPTPVPHPSAPISPPALRLLHPFSLLAISSFNKAIQVAARATRTALKEEERLLAEKRGAVTLKWQTWENGKGSAQVSTAHNSRWMDLTERVWLTESLLLRRSTGLSPLPRARTKRAAEQCSPVNPNTKPSLHIPGPGCGHAFKVNGLGSAVGAVSPQFQKRRTSHVACLASSRSGLSLLRSRPGG